MSKSIEFNLRLKRSKTSKSRVYAVQRNSMKSHVLHYNGALNSNIHRIKKQVNYSGNYQKQKKQLSYNGSSR